MYLRTTLKKLCSGAQRFCKEQSLPLNTVDGEFLNFGASEGCARIYSCMTERANKARNAEHHRCSDGVQRSLQEQRVYGECLGFKKR